MPVFRRSANRDPWWESDGPAARREHGRRRTRALIALVTALLAVAAAALAWSLQLGWVGSSGLHLALLFA